MTERNPKPLISLVSHNENDQSSIGTLPDHLGRYSDVGPLCLEIEAFVSLESQNKLFSHSICTYRSRAINSRSRLLAALE